MNSDYPRSAKLAAMAFAATQTIGRSCLPGTPGFRRTGTRARRQPPTLLADPRLSNSMTATLNVLPGGTGLVYMCQRWYFPHTGTFASQARYPPMMEHEYAFVAGNPVMMVDPGGEVSSLIYPDVNIIFLAFALDGFAGVRDGVSLHLGGYLQ